MEGEWTNENFSDPGHLFAGLTISLVSLRWTVCTFYNHYLCQRHRLIAGAGAHRFRSQLTFRTTYLSHLPIEALVWVMGVLLLDLGALFHIGFYPGFLSNDLQHINLYSAFILPATVVVLKHYGCKIFSNIEYGLLVLAISISNFTFVNHTHHKSPLRNLVHQNLCLVLVVACVAVIIEMIYRRKPLAALFRCYSMLCAGTWILQIQFVIFNKSTMWPGDDHYYLMLTNLTFPWHFAVNLMVMTIICFCTMLYVSSLSNSSVEAAIKKEQEFIKGSSDVSCCTKLGVTNKEYETLLNDSNSDF